MYIRQADTLKRKMRLNKNNYDLTQSVPTTEPPAVCAEVVRIHQLLYDNTGAELEPAFALAAAVYRGEHPEYSPCDTEYHDLQHVLDVTLAMARLLDGYERGRHGGESKLQREVFVLGILCALFHDFGYLRRRSDRMHRYGAEYTFTHVTRSGAFLRRYMRELGMEQRLALAASALVHFTGYERPVDTIPVTDQLLRRVGQMLGTADIIAQMSDRCYLEKCRDRLYPEFVLAGRAQSSFGERRFPVFTSPEDLLRKTPAFYEGAKKRLDLQLDRTYEYAEKHFGGDNPYVAEMEKNLRHAKAVTRGSAPEPLRRNPPRTLSPGVQPYPKGLLKRAQRPARSCGAPQSGRNSEAALIDRRLSKLAAQVLAGHHFEDAWELFRLQFFTGWKHTTVAGILGAWSQRQGIKVDFEVRKDQRSDLNTIFIVLAAR
jgi:hypothetical protein